MANIEYPQGMRFFEPRETAPDFVNGEFLFDETFVEYIKSKLELSKRTYKGKKQVAFSLLRGQDGGRYIKLNDYVPRGEHNQLGSEPAQNNDLSF